MRLKESICNSINDMNNEELTLLYEQIKLLKRSMKSTSFRKRKSVPIEKIHEMTTSSKSCWSDSVIEERLDRI